MSEAATQVRQQTPADYAFSCEFGETFKNAFSYRAPSVAVSAATYVIIIEKDVWEKWKARKKNENVYIADTYYKRQKFLNLITKNVYGIRKR